MAVDSITLPPPAGIKVAADQLPAGEFAQYAAQNWTLTVTVVLTEE